MKKLYCIFLLVFTCLTIRAQEPAAPKWVGKAQKNSIFTVLTYDKDKNLMHTGTGFYVGEGGVAIADYRLFRNAYSAVACDMKGNKYDITHILGADDLYSLVKFKVNTKKCTPLVISYSSGIDNKVYAVASSERVSTTCPQTVITEISPLDSGCVYMTLRDSIAKKYEGAPLFNEDAELIGVVQPNIGDNSYALGIKFIDNLIISAITSKSSSLALSNIHIAKALPESMEEALVYIYFKSRSSDNDEYMAILNEFIKTYPKNAEGYLKRATPLTDLQRFDEADNDLNTYLSLAEDKAKAHSAVAEAIYTKLIYQPEPTYDKWDYSVVMNHIDQAISLNPKSFDYRLQKGQVLMATKDYEKAAMLYDSINTTSMRSPATYYAACLAHEGRGDSLDVQIALMDSAVAMFGDTIPQSAASYLMRKARLNEAAGRYREAVLDYNRYCDISGNKVNDKFYYDRSQLERKGRMYQQCLDDLMRAININPGEALYHVEKSAIHLMVGQYDESIMEADNTLELNPELFDAYRIKGYAQIQMGDKANGRKNLEKAVSMGDASAKELIDTYLK